MVRVLFVCTGNICRSPTAEGVLRRYAEDAGLGQKIKTDSAGTHGYHVGERPDPRAVAVAARRGFDLSGQRARRIAARDFERFDYVVALDQDHKRYLASAFREGAGTEIRLLMEYAPELGARDVPDPYDGSESDFEHTLDMIEAGARGLLEDIRGRL